MHIKYHIILASSILIIVIIFLVYKGFTNRILSLVKVDNYPVINPVEINIELQDKALASNFIIEKQFNKSDKNGRSVIYKDRKGANVAVNGAVEIGRQFVFIKWENIPKSNDKYIIFQYVGEGNVPVKSRVIFDKDSKWGSTKLYEDNLTQKQRTQNLILIMSDLSKSDLDSYFQKGDAINYGYQDKKNQDEMQFDENKIAVIKWLEIRRFL